jgi:hypothetical protein
LSVLVEPEESVTQLLRRLLLISAGASVPQRGDHDHAENAEDQRRDAEAEDQLHQSETILTSPVHRCTL